MHGLAMAVERNTVRGGMVEWPSIRRTEDREMINRDLITGG